MKKSIIVLLFFFFGCVSRKQGITGQYGKVTSIEGRKVCVTYKVLNIKDAYVVNCYLQTGIHDYIIGDKYPK